MKTLIALLALSCPVFAGWTYPSLARVYALDLPPCYIPPGGNPPGCTYECPAGYCVPAAAQAQANQVWKNECEFEHGEAAWNYDNCVTTGWYTEPECYAIYYGENGEGGYLGFVMEENAEAWQEEMESNCVPCD